MFILLTRFVVYRVPWMRVKWSCVTNGSCILTPKWSIDRKSGETCGWSG